MRDQYTVYARFLHLEKLLGHALKIRCNMEKVSGFRASFLTSFQKPVTERRADGWFLKVIKESTIDQKDVAIAKAKKRFTVIQEANLTLDKYQVERLMNCEKIERMAAFGKWEDRWLTHPVSTTAEPDKWLCGLTDIDQIETDLAKQEDHLTHAARLYLKGSFHAVDRGFMQIRRRLSFAEGPYATASSNRRMWYGYTANSRRIWQWF